jgi:hypothetical protein
MNKTKKDEQERLANYLYDYKQLELVEQSNTLEQVENECHRAMDIATRNYNEILVRFYYLIKISNEVVLFIRLMKQRVEQMNRKHDKQKNN